MGAVTRVGVGVEELVALSSVLPPVSEVDDQTLALLGEHRTVIDDDLSDRWKTAKDHGHLLVTPAFYPTNSCKYPPSVDKCVFVHSAVGS